MKKILLTGISGQVGRAIQQAFLQSDLGQQFTLIGLPREALDLTQARQIREVIRAHSPHIIIHPAAYTAVDKAESEPQLAHQINAIAPHIIAEEAKKCGAGLIHFSTDYVYDGNKAGEYVEGDATRPLSVYGASKLVGEEAIRQVGVSHLILRTAWVYSTHGRNFLNTILRLAAERESLNVVADQVGAPTSAGSIAQAVCQMVRAWQADTQEVYHLVSSGHTSWHGFAQAIVAGYAALCAPQSVPLKLSAENILAITTDQYPTAAVRPKNARLSTQKIAQDFGIEMPRWQTALAQVLSQHYNGC